MRLRPDVAFEMATDRFGEDIVVLDDRLVRRSFAVPEEAIDILQRLRLGAELADLHAEFDGTHGLEEVDGLLAGLTSLALLEEDTAPDVLRRRLVDEQRDRSWRAMREAIRYAGERVPIYRRRWQEAGVDVTDVAGRDDLHRLPLLTKEIIRENYPDGFVPEGLDLPGLLASGEVMTSVSSGSSAGDRLQMIFTADARGLQMAAGTTLNDEVRRAMRGRQAVLTSMHCADPLACVRDQPEVAERIREGNRLLLLPPRDPGAPTREEVQNLLHELRWFQARAIDCNPTYLANVTYAAVDAGLELPRVDVITCGYEFLTASVRRFLASAWGCPVYNRYTASEVGNFQILECEQGRMHLNDKYYYAEIVRDGRHAAPGELGRLVQTTLQERIPIVRYDTEDLFVAADDSSCPCGGITRVVGALAGRVRDLVTTADGHPLTTRDVDEALSAVANLRLYQVVQSAPASYAVKVVADPAADAGVVRADAAGALRGAVGQGAEIKATSARRIYPEPSDKFRICRGELADPGRLVHV